MPIILASASKRRRDLLKSLGLDFKAVPSKIDEKKWEKKIKDPKKLAVKLAWEKALAVKKKLNKKGALIIGVDTFVFFQGEVLGKPKNKKEAAAMLKKLSAKEHLVISGLVVLGDNLKKKTYEISKVVFKKITPKMINDYLKTGVYLDRAGSYGIQDEKCSFVKSYKGSYVNILGLPIKKLKKILKELGIKF